MQYGNDFTCSPTAAQQEQLAERILDQAWQSVRPVLLAISIQLFAKPLCPSAMYEFESKLVDAIRSLGRLIVELALNRLEPELREDMTHDLMWEAAAIACFETRLPIAS